MTRYWSKLVDSLDPYVPGEQPQDQQYIKLNTNESPYPPAPGTAASQPAEAAKPAGHTVDGGKQQRGTHGQRRKEDPW